MKNRLLSCFLALCMLLGAIPTAAAYKDTELHWAKDYIEEVTTLGLFQGMGEDEFAPDIFMSRGMFVTVLGRFEGITAEEWTAYRFFDDVPEDSYYAPYVNWAVHHGIVNGMDEHTFAPEDPVTREQMAKLIHYYSVQLGRELPTTEEEAVPFADEGEISFWAAPSVKALQSSGILNGVPMEDGRFAFLPMGTATRAEAAAVFSRLHAALQKEEEPVTLTLDVTELHLGVGESYPLHATPEGELTWASSDEACVLVDASGMVTAVGAGEAVITVTNGDGLQATCHVTVRNPLPDAHFTKTDKCMYLFGEEVADPRLYYGTSEEAFANMQNVTVQCWDLNKDGEKYTRTWTLTVHKNLAAAVEAIFAEIYAGEEQFPIEYLGGYGWSGKSEHSIGCAIDINWKQNYYCDPNGNAITGDYWKPYEDPYSITPDGDVVRAFEKYGFIWCINWNSGYKDYMHFSFFGT